MRKAVVRFVTEESGADLIEYALLAALVSLAGVLSLTNIGTSLSTLYGNINTKISGVTVP